MAFKNRKTTDRSLIPNKQGNKQLASVEHLLLCDFVLNVVVRALIQKSHPSSYDMLIHGYNTNASMSLWVVLFIYFISR